MKPRMVIGVLGAFVLVSAVLVAVLFGKGLFSSESSAVETQQSILTPTSQLPVSKVIQLENERLGTNDWMIPSNKVADTQIQAYTGATSVAQGQKLSFYVSTRSAGTHFSINIYRMGWYGGLGGRLMFSSNNLTGQAQGYYDTNLHRLVNCRSCFVNYKLGLVEANWQPSYTLTIPSSWVTGVYLAKFTDAQGMQTYAPFDVLGNYHSTFVAVTDDTTAQAYNVWGGYSLYVVDTTFNLDETLSLPRGSVVSFDRPYVQAQGSGQILPFDLNIIHWLERESYDVSYISAPDLQANPTQTLHHKAVLVLGHSEYWSKVMRDSLEQARDSGVGLAFLGANDVYWQIRFQPDNAGIPNRDIVCYKVGTVDKDLAQDPLYGKDNTLVTTQWRDPLLNRPENALIGIMYSEDSWDNGLSYFPAWHVSPDANSPLLNGTNLQPGQQYGCDLVGYEWDGIVGNGATPVGLQVLGTTNTFSHIYNKTGTSNTTYYIALSGAMVFATGSIYWTFGLDSYRLNTDKLCTPQSLVVPGMQKLMSNVMDALVVSHNPAQITSTPHRLLTSLQIIALSVADLPSLFYQGL